MVIKIDYDTIILQSVTSVVIFITLLRLHHRKSKWRHKSCV